MEWIKKRVIELQEKYKTVDLHELATLLNVIVIPFDLHDEIKGIYKYDRRNKYIFINSNLSANEQRVVLAHELGHAVLHTRSNTKFLRANTLFSINKIEKEANIFAAELLINDDELKEEHHLSLQQIASLHMIPIELIELKRKGLFL